jgi:threonine dehydrogenase-like Zn-dependent dehydrogenase
LATARLGLIRQNSSLTRAKSSQPGLSRTRTGLGGASNPGTARIPGSRPPAHPALAEFGTPALLAGKLGASRIIALSRNPSRQALAKEFGATDIVEERGDEAVEAVMQLTGGGGGDRALECVGTDQSIETATGISRVGGMIGAVGLPLYKNFEYRSLFRNNVGIKGGIAPARQYIPELLDDVLAGRINPGRVFDFETDLDHIAEAYTAMDERRAIKSLIRTGAI